MVDILLESRNGLLNRDKEINGHVTIDYVDPVTNKVKERIQGRNHIFKDQFAGSAWLSILQTTANDQLFITDDNTPPDDNFQYLRGNILGWGRNRSGALGLYRGDFSNVDSIIAKFDGTTMKFKYVYDFTGYQVPGALGSVGLTGQYMNFMTANLPNYPRNRVPFNLPPPVQRVYKGIYGYSIGASTGIITRFNVLTKQSTETNVLSLLNGVQPSPVLCVGVNAQDNRMYVYSHHSTVANRRLWEFSDDTFTTLLRTFNDVSNISRSLNSTATPAGNLFVVYKDLFYAASSNTNSLITEGGIVNNGYMTSVKTPVGAYFTAVPDSRDWSLVVTGGKRLHRLVEFYNSAATNSGTGIFNMEFNKFEAFVSISGRSASTNYVQEAYVDPTLSNEVLMLSNYADLTYYSRNALTCYPIPNGAPPRPKGMFMRLVYDLDIQY